MGEGGATEVYFYHLERRTLDDVLPTLLELSLKRGWRAVVQATSEERVAALDTLLWTYEEESFLPHGTAGDGRAAAQPIYLTASDENPNAAHIRFLVDGATLADVSPYARVAYVFDGRDQDAVARARQAWREAKARGDAARYFQQDADGRWLDQSKTS
jgi:DNA polymerase-3 subunit chi